MSIEKNGYLCAVVFIIKCINMALAIKSPPVLTGEAAREFYKRAATAKCSESKEEVQESYRKWKAFWTEQERLHPSTPW